MTAYRSDDCFIPAKSLPKYEEKFIRSNNVKEKYKFSEASFKPLNRLQTDKFLKNTLKHSPEQTSNGSPSYLDRQLQLEKKKSTFSRNQSHLEALSIRCSQPQPSEEPKKKSPKKSKRQKELEEKFEFFENFKQPKLYPDQAPVLERIKNKILDRMHKSTDKSMENSKQHINVEIRESQEESPVTGHKDEMSARTDREILPQIAKKCKSRNLIKNQKESSRKYRSKFSLPRYPSMPGCGSILFKDYTKKNVKNKDIEKIGKFKEKVIQISTKQREATEALNRSIDHESNEVDKMIQKMKTYIRNR